MNYIQRVEHWGDHHHPKYLDLLRIVFGIFLCYKGVQFAQATDGVANLVDGQVPFGSFMLLILSHYVLFAHIAGGFLIAVGLLTRIACIIQIPVLLGAIIFVRWDTMLPFSELLLALVVMVLLIYFLIIGSGPWSLDRAIEEGSIR